MTVTAEQVEAAAAAIRERWPRRPAAGVILGTGLANMVDEVEIERQLSYDSIPHFSLPTAPAHRGTLVCGTMAAAPVVVMAGRVHGYEGYRAAEIGFGVRVMAALGTRLVIVTSASGGMNPNYRAGDVVIIEDHVNLTFGNPLVGPHGVEPDVGYPDMSCPYDPDLIQTASAIARRENFVAHRGVYVGVLGPNYETRAEYRFLRRLGGDVVGMSTVHEVIVARQRGLRVLGLSVVTNECLPDALKPPGVDEVAKVAKSAEPKVRAIVRGVIAEHGRH
jgi:purine-nucleoside phosphorylase